MLKSLIIGPNDAGQRLDKFLQKSLPNLPKSACYKALRKKQIKRNRKRCAGSDFLQEGDRIDLYLPADFFAPRPEPALFTAQLPPILSVYEDDHLLVLDKPAGLKSQPDASGEDSLILRVWADLKRRGLFDPNLEQSFRPALCNRLDRNTRGLVIAAKDAPSLREMQRCLRRGDVVKTYWCIVHGAPTPSEAVLTGWWTKDRTANRVLITPTERPNSKQVKTGYRLLEQHGDRSLLEVTLFTGRSHQIRAHLASIGHPLLGDRKYGGTGNGRQRLAAVSISFHIKGFASSLSYLNGKTISLPDAPFASDGFFARPQEELTV